MICSSRIKNYYGIVCVDYEILKRMGILKIIFFLIDLETRAKPRSNQKQSENYFDFACSF